MSDGLDSTSIQSISNSNWVEIHRYEHNGMLLVVWEFEGVTRVRVRSIDGGQVFSHGTKPLSAHDDSCFVDVMPPSITIKKMDT